MRRFGGRFAARISGGRGQSAERSANPSGKRLEENLLQELHGCARQVRDPAGRKETDARGPGGAKLPAKVTSPRCADARNLPRTRASIRAQGGRQVDIREAIGPLVFGIGRSEGRHRGHVRAEVAVDRGVLPKNRWRSITLPTSPAFSARCVLAPARRMAARK